MDISYSRRSGTLPIGKDALLDSGAMLAASKGVLHPLRELRMSAVTRDPIHYSERNELWQVSRRRDNLSYLSSHSCAILTPIAQFVALQSRLQG